MENKLKKYGFSLIRKRELNEIDATLYEMEHTLTLMRLIYLDREDENKTFAIGFTTPPSDNTGVFHIIEHSVLCGSEKYPLRDPFAELLKGSLNTFLNAITYEDRTIYPVSSRCEKDFLNLTDVYMDAVFAPKMLENESIFHQEGWHFELDEETNTLSRNGVVYNEMKGAYSSPDELGGVTLARTLFDGTEYGYDSGGDPDFIPELDYSALKEAHTKYYHPSNAKIFLDGRIDLDKLLPVIAKHLCRYEARRISHKFNRCSITEPKEAEISYEISDSDTASDKARVLYGYIYSDFSDKEAMLSASIISDLLCGSNASPLKKALIDRHLAKDVAMYATRAYEQTLILEVRDCDEGKLCEIDSTVKEVISTLIKEGIDKDRLRATLNSIEFRLRERDFGTLPMGIAYAMSVFGSWNYGGLPEDALLINDAVASVRSKIDTDYFEKVLSAVLIDNPRCARVVMHPDSELGRREAEREENSLKAILDSMTKEEIRSIKDNEARLRTWQQTEEDERAIASLPTLSLSDVPEKREEYTTTVKRILDVDTVRCNVKTNGIFYLSLYIELPELCQDELIELSMLASALINLPTESLDALSLQNEIKSNLGSLFTSFAVVEKDEGATPYLKIGASALSSKADEVIRLLKEILTTKINDAGEIEKIAVQMKNNMEDAIIASGEALCMSRIEASLSEVGAINEYVSGYEAYRLLSKILETPDGICRLTNSLYALFERIKDRRRLTVSVTGDIDDRFVEKVISLFPEGEGEIQKRPTLPCADNSEFFLVPSKVAYSAMGGKSKRVQENQGIMRVVRSILSYEYLWSTVRMKNGAYGTGLVVRRNGSLAFYSYRDPLPNASIEYYRQSIDYLRALARENTDITKFIIGAIGEYDTLITPRTASLLSARDYFSGKTPDEERQIRLDMLAMTPDKLNIAADIIDEVLSGGAIAVVGSNDQLERMPDAPRTVVKI